VNSNSYLSTLDDVEAFLADLKSILAAKNYDLDMIFRKTGEDPLDPFTTANTLADLDFDTDDVRDELLSLTARDYLETMKDDKDESRPPFLVFGKDVRHKPVYIKVKIRSKANNKVFCVSFHYPRHPLILGPYT
jgi:hypothetical protein